MGESIANPPPETETISALLLGPSDSGKTCLANALKDASERLFGKRDEGLLPEGDSSRRVRFEAPWPGPHGSIGQRDLPLWELREELLYDVAVEPARYFRGLDAVIFVVNSSQDDEEDSDFEDVLSHWLPLAAYHCPPRTCFLLVVTHADDPHLHESYFSTLRSKALAARLEVEIVSLKTDDDRKVGRVGQRVLQCLLRLAVSHNARPEKLPELELPRTAKVPSWHRHAANTTSLQAHQPKQGSRQSSKQQKEPPTEVPTQHRSAAALKGRSNNAQVEDAPGGFEPKQQPTELGRSLPPPIESPAEADFEDHSKRATMSTLEEAQEEEAPVRDPWDILPVQVAVLPGTKEEEGKRRLITASKDVVVVNETTIKRSAALERWQTEEDLRQIVKVLSECEKKQQLVPLLGVMFETGAPDRMFCLTKFMPGGTVEHLIRSKRPSRHEPWVPPRTKSLRWSLCLARALRYLHLERGIVHGNVRPSNLLLGSDSDDLRLATAPILLPPEHHVIRSSHSLEGVLYTAPEVMTGRRPFTTQIDIYSFAFVVWFFCSGRRPLAHLDNDGDHLPEEHILELFEKGTPPRPLVAQLQLPKELRQLLSQAWDAEPEHRPSAGVSLWRLEEAQKHTNNTQCCSMQ